MAEAVDETRRQLLADPKAYIDRNQWMRLLQDYGSSMSEDQRKELEDAIAAKKKKNFKERIHHGDRLYPELYELAKMLFITYNHDDRAGKWFTKLPKNPSDAVHRMGRWIAANRTKVSLPDVHLHQDADLTDVMKMDGFEVNEVFYYLPQSLALTHFFGIWGVNMDALMKPEVDDVLRLTGILLTDEQMRDYIPDILGKRRNESGWQPLDAAPSRAKAAWALLLRKFIDEEVNVTLPDEFLAEDMQQKVDAKVGEGFYNRSAAFNPNNGDRMKLAWSETRLKSVLQVGVSSYEKMMVKYQKGTGGGPGAPQNFVDWQNRHESHIINYTNQKESEFYLTVVFMRDKQHNFPLKPSSGPMPPGVGIEDEDFGDTGGETNTPQHANTSTTQSRSDKRNKPTAGTDISSAIKQLTSARQKTTNDLIKALVNGETSAEKSTSDKQYEMVGRISDMRKAIKESENDIKESKAKRSRIEEKYADNPQKKRKNVKKINDEIKQQEMVRETLKTTMMQYTTELRRLNGEDNNGNDDSDCSDNNSSGGSSSEDSSIE
jgi:hypothetical protein